MGTNEKELKKLNTFITHTLDVPNKIFKETIKEFGKRVILRTPVLEIDKSREGETRGNYNTTIGSPNISYNQTARDPSGQNTINNMNNVVNAAPPNSVIYIANGVPWIGVLSRGGYVKDPIRGTMGDDGNWYIRSSGGWSKQLKALGTPYAMDKLTVLEFNSIVEEMKRKYG